MITIKNLNKSFGDKLLYNIEELELDHGFTLLKGDNGCGKSTFLKMLYKITDYNGEIYMNNTELNEIDDSILNNEIISYIDQQNQLFLNANCQENFSLLLKEYDKELLDNLLQLLNFQEIFASKKKVKQLSGGEKQKLQLIIGLLKDVDIYLLDEIDNNLDTVSIENIVNYLQQYQKKTVIIVSHDAEYYEPLNCNVLEFTDGSLELKKNDKQINENLIVFNNQEKNNVNSKIISKMYQTVNYKFLIVNLVIALVLSLFISKFYIYEQYFKGPDEQFATDDVAIIIPPINNPLFYAFGDNSWLQKIPHFFSEEFYEYFEDNYNTRKIISITSLNGEKNSTNIKDEKYSYMIADDEYAFVHTINPKVVNTNTPYNTIRNVNMIAGDYPDDNTNQILIPASYADKYIDETYEEAIGSQVEIKVMKSDMKTKTEEDKLEFVVSGIYQDPEIYKGEKQLVVAFNSEDQIAKENNCSLFSEKLQQDTCIQQLPEVKDIDFFNELVENDETGLYAGLYVEFADKESLIAAAKDLDEYEQYIYFDSNYTRSHDNNFKYLKKRVFKTILVSSIVVILGICVNYFVLKQHKEIDRKNRYKQKCFGVKSEVFNKIIRRQTIIKSLLVLALYGAVGAMFTILFTSFKLIILINSLLGIVTVVTIILVVRRYNEY